MTKHKLVHTHLIAFLLLLGILFVPNFALAANHYIRAGATGTGNGSDWTNAYSDLPASLTRGDIYYVAGGTYGSHQFNDRPSGTATIEIRTASMSDHGTSTGWSDTYVGTATFTCSAACQAVLDIQASYITINGAYRGSNWQSGYGITVSNGNINATIAGIRIGANYQANHWYDHVTIKYVNIDGSHATSDYFPAESGVQLGSGSQNITLQYNYIHDTGGPSFFIRGPGSLWGAAGYRASDTVLLEYNYIARNYGSVVKHSEGCSCSDGITNFVVRYNYWFDLMGTSIIATPSGGGWNTGNGHNGPWSIYGNVFGYTQYPTRCGLGGGVLGLFDVAFDADIYVLNNTVTHLRDGGDGCPGSGTGPSIIGFINTAHLQTIYYYNNLVWNSEAASYHQPPVGTTMEDYSAYYDSTSTLDVSANKQISAGNPFTNWLANKPGADFTIIENTNRGIDTNALVPGNAKDMNGRKRTTWSRGAFEFINPSITPPIDPPKRLRIF